MSALATPPRTGPAGSDPPFPPRLAGDVEIHPPAEDGAPWVIQRGRARYYRVGVDVAKLALALDGRRDADALASHLGRPWTPRRVHAVLAKFEPMGLLDDGSDRGSARDRWVTFLPPLTVQFTLIRPERLFQRLRPVLRAAAGRLPATVAVLVGVAGVLALAAQAVDVRRALGEPLPVATYVAVVTAFLVSTGLHEFGHGATLCYHGGRPTRMGLMLFYLAPAFFCDVTDGWRLPRREQRLSVALAGVAVQAVIGGAVALAAPLVPAGAPRDGALLFAAVAYLSCVLNLVPLVKLDGYLALMSRLDIPYLRDRALTDARRALARVLFGGGYERALDRRWSVPFGLACMLFPVYLVATALRLWSDTLQGAGVVGSALLAAAAVYLCYLLGRSFVRVVREARRAGAGAVRTAVVTALLLAGAGAALAFVQVPYTVSGGYVSHGDRVDLLLPSTADGVRVPAGGHVALQRGGVVTRSTTGSGVVADATGVPALAPVTVFVPVRLDGGPRVPVTAYPVRVDTPPADPSGVARLDAGRVPLGKLLYLKIVTPWGW